MKRLLISGALATGLHALLLGSDAGWFTIRPTLPRLPGSIEIALSYKIIQKTAPEARPVRAEVAPPAPPKPHILPKVVKPAAKTIKKLEKKTRPKPKKEKLKARLKPPDPPPPPDQQKVEEEISEPPLRPAAKIPAAFEEADQATVTSDFKDKQVENTNQTVLAPQPTGPVGDPIAPMVREATPLYRQNPLPTYPMIARRRGYEGTVLLEVFVDKEGLVTACRLLSSCGHAVLDQAAMASVKTWEFVPATRGDQKIAMWVKVPVRFQLE